MSRNSRISLIVLVVLLIAGAYSILTGNRGPVPGTAVAAGTGMVMYDANGQEVGPVVDITVTDEAGHDETDQVIAVVAITLPDATGTPRTFLQRVTRSGFVDHYTQGFGIRFTGHYCTGTPYMSADDVGFLGFPEAFVPSMTLTPPARREQIAFAVTDAKPESVAVVSVMESNNCAPAGFTEDGLYQAQILSPDLAKAFPPPFTIRGQ